MAKHRNNQRNTRKAKQERGEEVELAKSHNDRYGYKDLILTPRQKQCRQLIADNTLSFIVGAAGSGKSTSVLYSFVEEFLVDQTKQIVVIRTPVEAGMDKVGALPDSLEAKIEPHFQAAKDVLTRLLNKGKVECDLGKRIHFKVPNYVLGQTFDNCLILIDEAQQLPPKILKLLLERVGKNSKVVVAGDNSQLYVEEKKRNGLRDGISRFFIDRDGVLSPRYEDVDIFEFGVEDVQRSEIVKTVIKAYSDVV